MCYPTVHMHFNSKGFIRTANGDEQWREAIRMNQVCITFVALTITGKIKGFVKIGSFRKWRVVACFTKSSFRATTWPNSLYRLLSWKRFYVPSSDTSIAVDAGLLITRLRIDNNRPSNNPSWRRFSYLTGNVSIRVSEVQTKRIRRNMKLVC